MTTETMQEKGQLSIHTENIFPIIKKFLYSDHEIFLRELVSNAVDASQKLKRLASLGEFSGEMGDLKVTVSVDKEAKTITVADRGIGMTADEVKKYINQIAFSGATEFMEKYKGEDAQQIIGKFGLGFYSSFMVSERVDILTLSHRPDSEAVKWTCDGSTEFELSPAEKTDRGTEVVLHVAEDSEEFLDSWRLKQILEKYCKFLPVEVEFDGQVINNPNPIWTKAPADLKDEDYLNFYKELYPFAEDPLFWIHLNVDYPFNLTGVLYFPKIKNDLRFQKEKIQLYSRQVFITDEVKDVVPEFLMLLHGVLDSPDIPLNVSRSYLQADGNVKKINSHITKKVADKLSEIFNNDRAQFEQKFEDIALFVKYGMLSDDKFYDRAKAFCLVKNTANKFFTFDEYRALTEVNQKDKNDTTIWLYTTDVAKQDSFVQSATKRGYDVLVMDTVLDSHFINLLESKLEKISVKRVDADSIEKLIDKGIAVDSVLSSDDQTKVQELFKEVLTDTTKVVEVQALPADEAPVSLIQNEFMRRMNEMSQTGGSPFFGSMPASYQVVVNANHPVISRLLTLEAEQQKQLAKQAYDLALLSQGMLKGADLTAFIQRTISGL
ncbi:MAG: molecular chaperone HtpG [Spirosomataceae bacterium]